MVVGWVAQSAARRFAAVLAADDTQARCVMHTVEDIAASADVFHHALAADTADLIDDFGPMRLADAAQVRGDGQPDEALTLVSVAEAWRVAVVLARTWQAVGKRP